MKIFKSFSFMVTMLFAVVWDLRILFLFFIIMIVMFSMIFNVIAPPHGAEYSKVGPFFGNLMVTLRISLGDFDFSALENDDLDQRQHIIYWVFWVIINWLCMVVFVTFMIAVVCETYQDVKDTIDSQIQKERSQLINLAEDAYSESYKLKNKNLFPKYVVIREQEF
jgi:hypothetical protein